MYVYSKSKIRTMVRDEKEVIRPSQGGVLWSIRSVPVRPGGMSVMVLGLHHPLSFCQGVDHKTETRSSFPFHTG